MLHTTTEAEELIYRSYLRAEPFIPHADDSVTRSPGLTRQLLDSVGSPDQWLSLIHVTGSKGKGSTSRFISSLLSNLGYKVGLFTSPHLVDYTERIRIDGQAIADGDFVRICNQLLPHINSIEQTLPQEKYQGPVGIALAIALLYFQEQAVDYAVIEAGRGGRFDDTNVLDSKWAVLTPIYREHLPNLGPRLQDVIWHKSGIIKPSTEAVICNRQSDEVLAHLEPILLDELQASYVYGTDFAAENILLTDTGTAFSVKTDLAHYTQIQIPLLGSFQAYNVATALKTCEVITKAALDQKKVHTALERIQWPGRCEVIDRSPTVILDGAINKETAEYMREIIAQLHFTKIVSIVGVPGNKDYEGVYQVIGSFSDQLILTRPEVSHLPFPLDGLQVAQKYCAHCTETALLPDAVQLARKVVDADLLLIVGTQTLIGNAKSLWNHSLANIGK